uniref:Type-1 restriction enzyme MjaXIP specificity protein n=1 Tax=Candidatus Methanophagaceae archaeon ANME-1 ERB6 TaxID=2759912 RepID=A0A7G9YU61_9EURY|nr:type-1 restriction enzyme MjaXIP specificity protein [Methanosarcinales archaeon ANME-1 ERB6]
MKKLVALNALMIRKHMKQTKFKQTEIGKNLEEWEVKELKEDIELVYGKSLTEKKRVKGNYPVFGSKGVVGFHNEFLVKGPGIIIGRKGSVGEVKFSKRDFWPIDTTYYVKLKNKGNIVFWYYFLLNLGLSQLNSHSAVPGLNRDQVYRISEKIPPLQEQTAIAKILSDLDSKIELLQKQNKTLEAIGQAIFKHWFVDFEFPNEEGKPYKSSGGEMVYSEDLKKEIPEGWWVGKIGEILKIQIGGDWGKDTEFENAVQVNSLRGVDLEKIKLNGYSEEAPLRWLKKNSLEKRKLTDCDILIGGSGLGPIGRTIYFSKELEGLYEHPITYSNFCKRLSAQTPSYAVYAEKVLEDMYISGEMKQYFTGTSIPNLDANSLLNHNIIIPSKDVVNDFLKIAISKFSKLYNKENMILSQIRDTLLPKLMSGEIRVLNNQKIKEAV